MEKFYVILLINKGNERGYLIDSPNGIMIAKDGFVPDVKQFKTYQDAQQFIRDKKVERKGIKAYIRDNQDLIKYEADKGVFSSKNDMWFLENKEGEKCFFDIKKDSYYFDKGSVGFCVWDDKEKLELFYKVYGFKDDIIIKKL